MNFRLARPPALIDINRIPGLGDTTVDVDRLLIGALVCHRAFEQPSAPGPLGDLLAGVARQIGHLPIRHRGTFAGSIAHAEPAAEWCVVLRTLDGDVKVTSTAGTRRIPAHDLFVTLFTTSLETTEILEEAPSPLNPLGVKGAGEGGITAAGAVIAAAVDDSLGVRGAITELPVTPEFIRRHLPVHHSTKGGHR